MKLRINNKTLKTIILTSIITAIIVGGVGVSAVALSASDIGFTSSHEDWQVDNAEDAINDLYEISKKIESTSSNVVRGTISIATAQEVELGFKPKFLLVSSGRNTVPIQIYIYDEEYSTTRFQRTTVASSTSASHTSEALGTNFNITETGFFVRKYNGSSAYADEVFYLAIQ